jgi:hypothetical protein
MQKRLVMAAAIAAILGAAAFSVFRAPWYEVRVGTDTIPLGLLTLDYPSFFLLLVTLLVNVYFFVRLLLTGLLLVNGGPTGTRAIAWYTPGGAQFQSGVSFAAALVMYAMKPDAYLVLGEAASRERVWGGLVLVGANLAAFVTILVISRDRALARTQTWVDDDGAPIPKRWIRSAPAERPLVKPPLESPGFTGGDPFRGAPPTGLAAALVKPPTKIDAPRKDDDDAPAPKLLT